MPVYKADEMQATPDVKNPNVLMKQFGGDLIKVGIVTYKTGETPPPHYHPNDEQWVYMLEGRVAHLLGDEIVTIGPGDLVHIPRNTVHGIRDVERSRGLGDVYKRQALNVLCTEIITTKV